jgi:cob(I)alamin adenosyltransferase
MVHTGDGKGKTTAALGMLVRSLAHGHPCAVVQFIKGPRPTGELELERWAGLAGARLRWDRFGEGFTWTARDRQRDSALAREGWDLVRRHLAGRELRFLLLDELNIVLSHGFLDTAEVVGALQARHPDLHVVVTGRGAPEALIQAADLVTEMRELKHPFHAGVRAQAGIEF